MNVADSRLSPDSMCSELTVGELAERAGTSVSALHFYERQGLLGARRTAGNQRRYRPDTLWRVRVILAERAVGQSVDAIRELLASLPAHRPPTRSEWTSFQSTWRASIDDRINSLHSLRSRTGWMIQTGWV